MVNIARRADGLFQFIQWELMSDDPLQFPLTTRHDLLHVPYILRHIATGADDALLGIGHVKQVNGAGLVVDCNGDKAALDFSKPKEIIQNTLRTGGIQPAVNAGNCAIYGRSRAEIANG